MSWASKNIFDPIKSLFHTDSAAAATLDAARASLDKALAELVQRGVASVMALVPIGATGLALEVLDDVISGLQAERAKLAAPPAAPPVAPSTGG